MGRRTAPHLGLQSRPRPALGAVAVPHRSLRNAAADGAARAETPLGADTSHGGSRRRGRRRHALRGASRRRPHTEPGQTGVLRLRRQIAGTPDRRFDRMAPKRLDACLRQLLRRRKPQRKASRRGIFRHCQRPRTPLHGRGGRTAHTGSRHQIQREHLARRADRRRIARRGFGGPRLRRRRTAPAAPR